MISIFAAIVAGYLMLVGIIFMAQRGLMYHPSLISGSPEENATPEFETLRLGTPDGLSLMSWYAPPDGVAPVLVFLQGNAGAISDRAAKVWPYLKAGYGVLLVGYRGFGGNLGSPTEEGLYTDAMTALRHLEDSAIHPNRWIICGESLGTGVAVEVAQRFANAGTPVGAVVLEAPFTSMGDAAATHYPYIPARILVRDKYASVEKITKINSPLLIIHGDADRVVPQQLGRRLFETALQPKQAMWIKGARHNDLYDFDAAARVITFAGNALTY